MSDDYFEWAAARYHEHAKVAHTPTSVPPVKSPATPRRTHEPQRAGATRKVSGLSR